MRQVPRHVVTADFTADGQMQVTVSPGDLLADFEFRSGTVLSAAEAARVVCERYGMAELRARIEENLAGPWQPGPSAAVVTSARSPSSGTGCQGPALVTGSHTDSGSPPAGGSDWPGPWDVAPYGDGMAWSPGDAEW
jgi:hypothetical protein